LVAFPDISAALTAWASCGRENGSTVRKVINDPKTLEAKALLERFKARYKGESPTSLLFVSAGYDGVKLLAKAIAEGGRSGEAIKNSLYTVRGYHGASGRVEISPEGSSKLKATVFKVVNEKLEAQDK
jgi:ABC-type branched-subunit amino acid transport system substrate-binding protein